MAYIVGVTTVTSPGSSANLGPGFDVLGVAVNRYVTVSDEAGRLTGEPCGPGHIARIAYEKAGGTGSLWFDFDLAPGRGLGFSAAARAAGAVLARLQQEEDIDEAQRNAYRVVDELEGHGDNAAPSVFGGLFVIAGQRAHPVQAELPGRLLAWVPESETPTDESRLCLEPAVDRADLVFNLGRVGLLLCALYEGRPDLLREATEDRVHQPARLAAAPQSREAIEAAYEAGAHAAWLSGSGPTVAIVCDPADMADVSTALPHTGSVLELEVDSDGSRVVS